MSVNLSQEQIEVIMNASLEHCDTKKERVNMTNFEKIVQGGPEAMVEYQRGPCADCCTHGKKCGTNRPYSCTKWRIEWLNSLAKIDISNDEWTLAQNAYDIGYRWVARDKSGVVTFFFDVGESNPPIKTYDKWASTYVHAHYSGDLKCDFVCWDDKNPVSLKEMLSIERR